MKRDFPRLASRQFDLLVRESIRADDLYRLQQVFHGSTAPGFLFASGFVAGLPRAPLSLKASVRRARRLLFVLGVGYALNLPYLSLWKTINEATRSELAAGLACNALHVIAGGIIMAIVAADAYRGRELQRVELIGIYWHFVDVIWIFLFPLLYIAK